MLGLAIRVLKTDVRGQAKLVQLTWDLSASSGDP